MLKMSFCTSSIARVAVSRVSREEGIGFYLRTADEATFEEEPVFASPNGVQRLMHAAEHQRGKDCGDSFEMCEDMWELLCRVQSQKWEMFPFDFKSRHGNVVTCLFPSQASLAWSSSFII